MYRGSADPSYFDRQIYLSELGKNVYVRDYASACYIRTGWKSLNPADGRPARRMTSTPSTSSWPAPKNSDYLDFSVW